MASRAIGTGREWVVDASGCRADALRDLAALRALFARAIRELALSPAAEPQWKVFDETGGITGMALLTESHLTVHTYPEHGFAAFNLYCCVPRADWPWEAALHAALGASHVEVRVIDRAAHARAPARGEPSTARAAAPGPKGS